MTRKDLLMETNVQLTEALREYLGQLDQAIGELTECRYRIFNQIHDLEAEQASSRPKAVTV